MVAALAALAACLAALTVVGDGSARRSTTTLAALLPIGVLATVPEPHTFGAVIAVVLLGLAATATSARSLSVRAHRPPSR